MRNRFSCWLFLSSLILCPVFLRAQINTIPMPKFEAEISRPNGYPPHFAPIYEHGSSFTSSPDKIPGWKSPDAGHPQATAYRLDLKVEGDAVVLTPIVILGPFDFLGAPQSLEGVPQQKLSSYTLHVNDSVTLVELQQFGLASTTVRIVAPKPSVGTPLLVSSKALSIQVESVEEDQRESYKVTLHNVSSKSVIGLAYGPDDGSGEGMTSGNSSHPIIKPGAIYELRTWLPHSGHITPKGFVEDLNPYPEFVITGVLFDDGSFEGESLAVAKLEMIQMAHRVQGERVMQLVDFIISDQTIDDDAKIARIRSEVPKLSDEPAPSMLESIHARHPDLPASAGKFLSRMLENDMSSEKNPILYNLKSYERFNKNGPSKLSLEKWWSLEKKNH